MLDQEPRDRVRCLDCGTTYAKPADGGTVTRNPGCPRCGYVGWVPAGVTGPRRFGEGRLLRQHAQPR